MILHLGDALPGDPGDNFSFVWNLWWMRFVLAHPALGYFHTSYLFYPFGAPLANHPHTALPALVAATVLSRASPVAAQNILLLAYVFLNMGAMYALAWSATRHARASIVAAVVFGLSPYIAVHMLGHFDLVAAFTLPLFALALRGSRPAIAGVILGATAYIAYYHVAYLVLFTIVYLPAESRAIGVVRRSSPASATHWNIRAFCIAAAAVLIVGAGAVVATGGWTIRAAPLEIAVRTPQNILTAAWVFAGAAALLTWRPSIRIDRMRIRHALRIGMRIALVFVAVASPLVWQAARLVAHGEYVSPEYGWRSIPRGVDLAAPLLGHPLHPFYGAFSKRAYAAIDSNFIEAVGWLGMVPLVVAAAALVSTRDPRADQTDARVWRIVLCVFGLWAIGPFLIVAGFDTGLKLPAILLRYVPFVANARMPGRAIVVVFMAIGMLLALAVRDARGRLASPVLQWIAIGAIVFDFWAAPLRLTTVDRPPVYQALAAQPAGAVCEVPFGIGDGLSEGVGSQNRRVLLYATEHRHPLVGGYIGRMPVGVHERYSGMPIVGTLIALSSGAPLPARPDIDTANSPCSYLVVDRRSTPAALAAYIERLAPRRIASDEERDLYRIR